MMRIGLDFDNTIVRYDDLFHRVAREDDLIPADLPVSKVAVRDHLRRIGQEQRWTAMQGEVYGARMAEAAMFPGLLEFLAWAKAAACTVFIISHKTRHPFLGPPHDLHAAARDWVGARLNLDGVPAIPPAQVFFEPTKADKLARIAHCQCDVFLDDLPEILLDPGFPSATERVLFAADAPSPAGLPLDWPAAFTTVPGWDAFRQTMAARCSIMT